MSFEIKRIPGEVPKDKRWKVFINDKERDDVDFIQLSSQFGVFTYGQRPEGYPAWVFTENNYGGSITIPFAKGPNKEVFVGLLSESRANMGGLAWCAPGGFSDSRETHKQTALREFREEVGMSGISDLTELPGQPINSNRAFFVANFKDGQGVHAYTFQIPFAYLQQDEGFFFKLKDEKLLEGFKKVSALRFISINQATLITADALALAAIAKLRVWFSL